eukprot:4467785-Pleurochrysis_carterae.AAC.2
MIEDSTATTTFSLSRMQSARPSLVHLFCLSFPNNVGSSLQRFSSLSTHSSHSFSVLCSVLHAQVSSLGQFGGITPRVQSQQTPNPIAIAVRLAKHLLCGMASGIVGAEATSSAVAS